MEDGGRNRSSGYALVSLQVLPEVFEKVLQAKQLLDSGCVHSISAAVRKVGLSRSAFYKYKDSVFTAHDTSQQCTLQALLVNEPGTLHALLAQLAGVGADVVTIHQQPPQGNLAQVAITLDTTAMHLPVQALIEQLRSRVFLRDIRLVEG